MGRASKGILHTNVVCKIPLLARRTRPKGRTGSPSAARDDRVSCIQIQMISLSRELFDHKQKIEDKYLSNYSALLGFLLKQIFIKANI